MSAVHAENCRHAKQAWNRSGAANESQLRPPGQPGSLPEPV